MSLFANITNGQIIEGYYAPPQPQHFGPAYNVYPQAPPQVTLEVTPLYADVVSPIPGQPSPILNSTSTAPSASSKVVSEKANAAEEELSQESLLKLDEFQTLIEIEKRIKKVLPRAQSCVVSIEGGTGVVVSEDGYILTASHVAKKAGRSVNVVFSNGHVVPGTTLGTNFNTDTGAVRINIPGRKWQYLPISDSSLVKPGDWCIALGYPLSFQRGKPAAVRLGRVLKADEDEIITDCPIMGGDSGGPLINLNGNLIGVSSRVKPSITQNIHIPIQSFQNEWKQLVASVDVRKRANTTEKKAYLGIFGETDFDRVRVRRVHRGSPAERAGLLAEDVILQIDGTPVECFDDVLNILDQRQPGENVTAKLNRFGTLLDLSIKLGPSK